MINRKISDLLSNFGLMKGTVVDNNDPSKVGRIKIRIPEIHSNSAVDNNYVPDSGLDWSSPCFPFFCCYDSGSFIVPPIGSCVWCLPLLSDSNSFVYIGSSYGIGSVNPKLAGLVKSKLNEMPKGELEIPKETQDNYAESGVLLKTLINGYSIRFLDKDDDEGFFEIISPNKKQSIKLNNCDKSGNSEGNIEISCNGTKITINNGNVEIEGTERIVLRSKDTCISF